MLNRELTEAEKETLLGLVKYPTFNNRELSNVLGIKPPTVTAICRRLRQRNVYRTVKMPIPAMLGWELFSFTWADLNLFASDEEIRKAAMESSAGHPAFAWIVDGTKYAVLSYSKNFTQAHRYFSHLVEHEGLSKVRETSIKHVNMPLQLTVWRRFFDFGPMLSHHFGKEWEDVRPLLPPEAPQSLTSTEREVFKTMVRRPEMTDKGVAAESGSSRQTVSRLRKEFESKGLIKTINIVDYPGLGYQLFYFFNLKCATVKDGKSTKDILDSIYGPDVFLAGYTKTEMVVSGFCFDFRELNDKYRTVKRVMETAGISPSDWNFEILTTDSMSFLIRHDYTNLVPLL